MKLKYIPIIVGPTGTGKTKISIELAKKINGEIISADSMQIYKDMNIGTAKVKKEEMCGIPHHMIDIIDPNENYSAAEFAKKTESLIEDILKRNKTPIIVGGTGLYINTLIYGIKHNNTFDENLRNEMNKRAESSDEYLKMYEEAKEIDPEAMEKISFNDKKRVLRILEIYTLTKKNKTQQEKENRVFKNKRKYEFKIFSMKLDRPFQYEVINKRVDKMLDEGLILENINVLNKYFAKDFLKENIFLPKNIDKIQNKNRNENENNIEIKNKENQKQIEEKSKDKDEKEIIKKQNFLKFLIEKYTSLQAIGYKEVIEYILGITNFEEMVEILKRNTRRYSKRQITWFKKNNPIWIDATGLHTLNKEKLDEEVLNILDKIILEIKYEQ